jgi:flagellin-like hook-associated protein FlgL
MIIHSNTAAANLLPGTLASRAKSISKDAATVGADKAELSSVSKTDLTAVGDPIPDEAAASESTESARQMIIAQNAMAMMAQANSMPLSALRLLQQ